MRGWQEVYREGIAALGDTPAPRSTSPTSTSTGSRSCGSCSSSTRARPSYGAPEYGGNRDLSGWRMIGYAGDVQPRGWSDAEVTGA